jgi:hypothetical protein
VRGNEGGVGGIPESHLRPGKTLAFILRAVGALEGS